MRTVEAAIQDSFENPKFSRIYFARLEFDSGTVAWNSTRVNIDFAGHTYLGVGVLGSIATVKEQPGVKSQSVAITISGVKQEIISLAQTEPYINRKAYIHCSVRDADGQPVTASPFLLFKGSIDDMEGEDGKTASITVTLKSRLADWERPRKIRYSDADQQKIHPGDKFFEFIPQLSQRKLIWPKAAFLPDPRD